MSTVTHNLKQASLSLPAVSAPAAAYVPYRIQGNTVYVSGQLPMKDGKPVAQGHLGAGIGVEQGQEAAKWCALNLLAHLKNACGGDLDKVKQVLKLEILVACEPKFSEPHVVANGASNVILTAFGKEIGAHARVAYGVASLPLGVPVEVAGTFEIA